MTTYEQSPSHAFDPAHIGNATGLPATTRGDEAALLEGLRALEPWAFERLANENAGRMRAVARRLVRSDQEADDAVQDAFLSAFKSIGSFTGASSLATWLHRITVNAALMRIRTRSRIHEQSAGDAKLDELMPAFNARGGHARPVSRWAEDAACRVETGEPRDRVRAAIDQLPPTYRTVLLLRDIEELDTLATAKALDCSEANVKTRLHRARQALRTLLEPLFGEDFAPNPIGGRLSA